MNIKPIKTELDYQNSLKRIDILMDSKPNSKKFYELDILTTVVEAYEEIHYKIEAPEPIEEMKFRIKQESLKQQANLILEADDKKEILSILTNEEFTSNNDFKSKFNL